MKVILDETIKSDPNAEDALWLMAGDFNSVSRADNFFYRFKDDDPYFSTHDMIAKETKYVDILSRRHPGVFLSTAGSWDRLNGARLDYVYVTPALEKLIKAADVSKDDYSRIRREFRLPTQAYRPSDHRPLIVDFNF
jgi:exonuclease III